MEGRTYKRVPVGQLVLWRLRGLELIFGHFCGLFGVLCSQELAVHKNDMLCHKGWRRDISALRLASCKNGGSRDTRVASKIPGIW